MYLYIYNNNYKNIICIYQLIFAPPPFLYPDFGSCGYFEGHSKPSEIVVETLPGQFPEEQTHMNKRTTSLKHHTRADQQWMTEPTERTHLLYIVNRDETAFCNKFHGRKQPRTCHMFGSISRKGAIGLSASKERTC